jgi:ABC-type amino acid transport system permease subunit
MIPDVQPNHLRPVNLDQTVAGGIKLSTEQGRALGLRNEQTVRGVVDESGLRVVLTTDQGSLQLPLPSRAQVFMELMFRTWVTPRGFVLQPLGQAEKKVAKSTCIYYASA